MCWQQIGYMMIIYIAGLQNVPGDLLEAAAIDGATGAQALFRVKLPMVMPSITICTFLTLTNSFKLFDQNLSLTGGEPAKASQMLALNIYEHVLPAQRRAVEGHRSERRPWSSSCWSSSSRSFSSISPVARRCSSNGQIP